MSFFRHLRAITLLLLCSPPLSPSLKAQEIAIGDSIALGIKDAGHLRGGAAVGASPRSVYHMVTTYPAEFYKNNVVILSCGVSNNPAQISDCDAMLQYLDDHGAKTILMGVGDVLPDSAGINNALQFMSGAHDGIFIYGWHDIHPRDYRQALSVIRGMECTTWRICSI